MPIARRPLVSVIVTTCDRARLLEKALRSIRSQTYRNYEVIVVDDAAKDDTSAVAAQFKARGWRVISLSRRSGSAAARNKAMRLAKGELTAFLDDDDIWAPEKLERQVALFERGPVQFVYSDFDVIDAGGKSLCKNALTCSQKTLTRMLSGRERWIVDSYRRCPAQFFRPMPQISSVLVRTKLLKRAGFFDVEFPRVYYDLDMWLRIRAICGDEGMHFMRESLIRYRIHEHQVMDVVARLFRGERGRRKRVASSTEFNVLVENLLFGVRFSWEHYYCREGRHVCGALPFRFQIPSKKMRRLLSR